MCDVTLVAGGTEVMAHKTVLASCSPYFYAMFTGFTESRANKITLQGLDGTALSLLIDYVYSAEVQVTEENVQASIRICVCHISVAYTNTSTQFEDESLIWV